MADLINRQTAIGYIKQQRARQFVGCTIEEVMITILEELPTVEERKTGTWIDHGFYDDLIAGRVYGCSVCGTEFPMAKMVYKYCTKCGARMKEETV